MKFPSFKFIRLFAVLILLPLFGFSQTGPGGVQQTNGSSNLVMWLDAGSLGLSDGSNVSSWADLSGYGNNASNSGSSRPKFNLSWENARPSVEFFNSSSDYLTIPNSSSTQFDKHTVFIIADYTNSSDSWCPFIVKTTNYDWDDGWGIAKYSTNEEIISFVDDYGTYGVVNAQNYDEPFMACQLKNGTDLKLFLGGIKVQEVENSGFTNSTSSMYLGATPDGGSLLDFLDGNIAEVIIFDKNLKSAERILVQNYLSSKYGIATNGDKYAYDATHSYEVFGIARKNLGTNHVSTSQGNGIVEISNPSSLGDEEFLLIGHDNLDLTENYEDTPPEYSYRVNRSWRVDETGDVGTVSLSFDVTGLGFPTDATEYALLIDTDGDFSNATTHTTGASYSGGVISFTGVDFSDGNYFSLAPYKSITWNGSVFANGSGASNEPTSADEDRKFYVYSSGASISVDCKVNNMVVSGSGAITISGNANMTIANEITNNGSITVNDGSGLVQESSTSTNSGSGNYVIKRTGQASDNSFNIFSSPITSAGLVTVFDGNNPCDMYTFDVGSQSWKYDFLNGYSTTCESNPVVFGSSDVIASGDGVMDVARGYFVPGNSTSTRSFSGTVNNGTINASVVLAPYSGTGSWEGDNFNLLGNPYPSAISASDFWDLNEVSAITNAIYFWDDNGTGSGYNQNDDFAYFNGSGGTASSNSATIPNGYIASGQGFFVIAKANTDVVFTNEMRGGTNTQFFKNNRGTDRSRFWISGSNSAGDFSQMLLSFDDNTSKGIDDGYDAVRTNVSNKMSLGSVVDNTSLVIQARPHIDASEFEAIPLKIHAATSGVHVFELDSVEDPLNKYELAILDSKYGKLYPLTNGMSGIYLSDTGMYENRFFLKVQNLEDAPNGIQAPTDSENFNGWFNQSKIYISSLSNTPVKHLELFTLTGRVITQMPVNNDVLQTGIQMNIISAGVYLVRLVLANNESVTLKVVHP